MRINKGLIIDLLILIVPVAIILLLTPVLPDRIPIHRSIGGNRTYIDKHYAFLLGLIPFVVYKLKYSRH